MRTIICPSNGRSIDSDYTNYVGTIIPPNCSGIKVLHRLKDQQKIEILELIKSSSEPLFLIAGDAVPSRSTFKLIVNANNLGTRALIGRPKVDENSTLLVNNGRIHDQNKEAHKSYTLNATSGGLLILDLSDSKTSDSLVEMLTQESSTNNYENIVEELTEYLSSKNAISAVDARDLPVLRMKGEATLNSVTDLLLDEGTEAKYWRNSCVKEGDNFWTALAISPWTKFIAAGLYRTRITPNQVTVFSFLLALLASGLFTLDQRWPTIYGGILVYLAFGADCIDGQLARLTGKFTRIGAWMDLLSDRIKEIIITAGLSLGASQSNQKAWALGAFIVATLVVRAQINQSFEAHRPNQNSTDLEKAPNPLGFVSRHYKIKNFLTFPYGNRMGLITVASFICGAESILLLLLAWNSFALLYQLFGRLRRGGGGSNESTVTLRGDGFIAQRLRSKFAFVNGGFVLLCLNILLSSSLLEKWSIFLIALILAMFLSSLSAPVRSIWLEPVSSATCEFGILLGLMPLIQENHWWIVFLCCAVFALIRLLGTTEMQLKHIQNSNYSESLKTCNFLGWEIRTTVFIICFYLNPIFGLIAVTILMSCIVAHIIHQGRNITNLK